MSGPKVSVYTITEERRAAIAEARKQRLEALERQRKIKEEHDRLCEQIENRRNLVSSFVKNLIPSENVASEVLRVMGDTELDLAIQTFRVEADAIRSRLSEKKVITDNKTLSSQISSEDEAIENLRNSYSVLLKLAEEKTKGLNSNVSRQVLDLFLEQPTPENSASTLEAIQAELDEWRSFEWLPLDVRNEVVSLRIRLQKYVGIDSMSFAELEIQPVRKKIEYYKNLWETQKNDFMFQRSIYLELCDELNRHVDSSFLIFSETALDSLKKEVAILEEATQTADERYFIETTLDEVMEEMGYNVLGRKNVTKKNGDMFHSELYRYGDNSAINITYGSHGQISMELGKVGAEDRLPTSTETADLESEMRSFCSDFKKIESKLAERGVSIRKRISMAPPTADYAQIINICDYECAGIEQKQENRRSIVNKPKHMTQENKYE